MDVRWSFKTGVMKELGGAVDFIAIPAEECVDYDYRDSLIRENKISFYGGKQEYLKRGGFDDVDMALQCHMWKLEMAGIVRLIPTATDL